MSHFISSIPDAGFREIPPVSKQTPFPTNAIGFSPRFPPFQRIITSLLSREEPCPTPSSAPIPNFDISFSSRTSTLIPSCFNFSKIFAKLAGNKTLGGSATKSLAINMPLATASNSENFFFDFEYPSTSIFTVAKVGFWSAFIFVLYLSNL